MDLGEKVPRLVELMIILEGVQKDIKIPGPVGMYIQKYRIFMILAQILDMNWFIDMVHHYMWMRLVSRIKYGR